MNNVTFYAVSDIVVIGCDVEFSDIENPRGEIYGSAAYVCAENERGDTRLLHVATERWDSVALAKAEKVAAALTARLERLGKLPVGFDSWAAGRPVYGSEAYEAYGQADDLAWERQQDQEPFFV
jgi:hypothetical protein